MAEEKKAMDVQQQEEEEEKEDEQVPDMAVVQLAFAAQAEGETPKGAELARAVMATVEAKSMAPWYTSLCAKHPELWKQDVALLEKMKAKNEARLKEIQDAYDQAEKDGGDMEVLDAMFDKATHCSRIGDMEGAYAACDAILDRGKVSSGKRIDAILIRIRVGLFQMDLPAVKEGLERARKLIELGGDWDRRNRLKVYESFYLIKMRDIKGAAALLLECVATFTCTELCSYKEFIFYAVITNVLSLPRTALKKRIIDGPEVLTIMPELPNARKLVESLYACEYRGFMEAMVEVNEEIVQDRYFSQHSSYLIRELRILAYTQFLNAYKSVILASMASAFGVSVTFLDKELGRFISAGRLNAKVDKVEGVVITNRPDEKNAQYQAAIKLGDQLLNRVQKLARVIDV